MDALVIVVTMLLSFAASAVLAKMVLEMAINAMQRSAAPVVTRRMPTAERSESIESIRHS